MTIHKEGFSTILLVFAAFIIINCIVYFCASTCVLPWTVTVTAIPLVVILNFFRCPHRHPNVDEAGIVAPADGTVVAIEEVYEGEYLKCKCLQVSVFMSVFNVHINWFPVRGIVRYVRHHNGRFQGAYLPKSSTENERTSVAIECMNGQTILVRQVAGALARRIVCYAKEGGEINQDRQMGFIKFGSRVDLYLPLGTQIDVKLKDKVVGSQTMIGWFK